MEESKKLNFPWEFKDLTVFRGKVLDYEVVDHKGDVMFFITNVPERVDFVKKAVNHHESLVEMLEQTAGALLQITKLAQQAHVFLGDIKGDIDEANYVFDKASKFLIEIQEDK